jgi:phenylpyruvate tautomerase PptA (4-oxalocrotonate tautomerase family)
MPLARIDLVQGKSAEYRRAIGDVVYEAMVEALNAPKDDRFQVISEHPPGALIADENYLGVRRTQECVFIQLTLNAGRTVEQKKAFYKLVAQGLHSQLGLRTEDVFINLIEVSKENWSFGNGIAQYA